MNIESIKEIAAFISKEIVFIEEKNEVFYFYDKNRREIKNKSIINNIEKNEFNQKYFDVYQTIIPSNKKNNLNDLISIGNQLNYIELPLTIEKNKLNFFNDEQEKIQLELEEDQEEIFNKFDLDIFDLDIYDDLFSDI